MNQSGSRVKNGLERCRGVSREAAEKDVAVVKVGDDEGMHKHFSRLKVEERTDSGDIIELEATGGGKSFDVWFEGQGRVEGLILDNIVKASNPNLALELGTYCGYSAVRIARLLKPGARLFTVEFNPEYAAVAKQIVEFAGVNDKVQIIEGSTHNIIPQLKKKCEIDTLDFVFVDHWKDKYTEDTKLLELGRGFNFWELAHTFAEEGHTFCQVISSRRFDTSRSTSVGAGAVLFQKDEGAGSTKSLFPSGTVQAMKVGLETSIAAFLLLQTPRNLAFLPGPAKCNLLKKGSVVLADNVIVPGAPDFLEYVRTCGRYDCTHYPSLLEYMNEKDALKRQYSEDRCYNPFTGLVPALTTKTRHSVASGGSARDVSVAMSHTSSSGRQDAGSAYSASAAPGQSTASPGSPVHGYGRQEFGGQTSRIKPDLIQVTFGWKLDLRLLGSQHQAASRVVAGRSHHVGLGQMEKMGKMNDSIRKNVSS
ncbi:unnamed protein product [Ranitomeya imitator]|uniref:catechol O-methyltransferase n=1 Tax=Ranitomeya imitator TaxID=111125 RepID=A0ABN9L8T3_9NEOB|nr:unnamed protein product [Ranitomeya imitator]